jgi:hypothetical protein
MTSKDAACSFSSHQATARCSHVRSPARLRNSSTARARPSGSSADAIRLNVVPGPNSKAATAPADRVERGERKQTVDEVSKAD